MHRLALLSPINEADELSPYRAHFSYARYPGQRSPIGTRSPSYNGQATGSPKLPSDTSMDDLWIYDCYVSEDANSPQTYRRSPLTPSHNRSISLPATTANFIPPNAIPLIKEPVPSHLATAPTTRYPAPRRGPMFDFEDDPAEILAYSGVDPASIDTNVYDSTGFPEYSPLEQEALSIWEVMNQLAAAADEFSWLESVLSYAAAAPEPPPDMDEDVVFWFVEALNVLVMDCTEVAMDLMRFGQDVEELLAESPERAFPPMPSLPRASFSEQDMKEVLATAASIPQREVVEALAALEASVPVTLEGKRRPRDRPPSLRLSTDDAVLLQARLPRARLQGVGPMDQFTAEAQGKDAMLRRHRGYVVIGDETPIDDDDWSAKSVVDFDGVLRSPSGSGQPSQVRTLMGTGENMFTSLYQFSGLPPSARMEFNPRHLSSPVKFGAKKNARRPPSLVLSDSNSRSSRYASSAISSLFSGLPRSSLTTTSRSSPSQSFAFDKADLKARFPTSTGNIRKMFSNVFKKREREGSWPSIPRSLLKRAEVAGTGSIDATLSALALSGMPPSPTSTQGDPFTASPPSSPPLYPSASLDMSALAGYSSMFNPLKAASRYPSQALFGGVELP